MFPNLKKVICLCTIIFSSVFSTAVFAQEEVGTMETMAPYGEYEQGGYGAPIAKVSRINDTDAIFSGIKGAWIVDHQYSLGLAAYTLVNNVPFAGYREPLQFGVVGANLEYIYPMARDFSLATSVLLGGGFVDFNDNPGSVDGVTVIEPEVNLLFGVTKHFKLALTGSYRSVAAVEIPGVSNNKLSGFTYGLGLNFGEF